MTRVSAGLFDDIKMDKTLLLNLGVDHVIRTGLNIEIGVEYRNFLLLCFFNVAVKCNFGHLQGLEKVG